MLFRSPSFWAFKWDTWVMDLVWYIHHPHSTSYNSITSHSLNNVSNCPTLIYYLFFIFLFSSLCASFGMERPVAECTTITLLLLLVQINAERETHVATLRQSSQWIPRTGSVIRIRMRFRFRMNLKMKKKNMNMKKWSLKSLHQNAIVKMAVTGSDEAHSTLLLRDWDASLTPWPARLSSALGLEKDKMSVNSKLTCPVDACVLLGADSLTLYTIYTDRHVTWDRDRLRDRETDWQTDKPDWVRIIFAYAFATCNAMFTIW